jgi:zinc-ribbon domain
MAMIACKECGTEISTTAKACPKCGAVVPRPKIWPWVIGVPVALFIALLLFGLSIPEYESRAREVRQVCEKMAGPGQRYICDEQYAEAIRKGRAESGN